MKESRCDYGEAGSHIPGCAPWCRAWVMMRGFPRAGAAQASWSLVLRCSSGSPVSSMFSRESACCTESSARLTLGRVFCSGNTQGLYSGSCRRFHSGYLSPAL